MGSQWGTKALCRVSLACLYAQFYPYLYKFYGFLVEAVATAW